jgi:PKD repeat protein
VLTASGASSYSWSSGGTNATETVSPNASTSYTVTGTDANGCSNVATVSVTVNPLPVVTAAASASSICAGTNDTLTASGASTYSWSTGGSSAVEIIAPSSSQTVTVTGTDANGCANTATATISVNPLPAVTISTSASSICTGDSVTMVASGANSYSWSSGGSNASEVIYPSATGSYTVTGTDVNGCVNTATVAVTVNANPVVTISADVQSGCAPLCVNFASTGSPSCVNSLWSFDDASTDNSENPTHCFVSGGNYSVVYTCTDANGCSSQMSMLITANQPPVASLTATATSACLSDGAIILSGTPAGGTYSGPGVTGASFSPSSAGTGTHSVVYSYTDANGCSDTAMIAITVNACTGIADLAAPGAVNLFPNPNNGAFTLQVNMSAPELIIEVTDLQGRIVFISQEQHIAPGFLRQVVLGDVAPGMYLVKLTSGNQHSVQQISIQK